MELLAAVLIAGPLGYLTARGRLYYLLSWAIVFPVQTVVVFSMDDGGEPYLYFVVNAVILTAGLGLNALGAHVRRQRATRAIAH